MTVATFVGRNANDALVSPLVESGGVRILLECGGRRSVFLLVRLAGVCLQSLRSRCHVQFTSERRGSKTLEVEKVER